MKLLLVNDDGIDAPGILTLEKFLGEKALVFAPSGPMSGTGHSVTVHKPFSFHKRSRTHYSVDGTPADCVRAYSFLIGEPLDWVFSGINYGGNLGIDLYLSGTAAAAREATLLGWKAIAFSQRISGQNRVDWEVTGKMAGRVWEVLRSRPPGKGAFWNVNFPHVSDAEAPELVFCKPSKMPLDISFLRDGNSLKYSGVYADRKREEGSDIDVCFSGNISISEVFL